MVLVASMLLLATAVDGLAPRVGFATRREALLDVALGSALLPATAAELKNSVKVDFGPDISGTMTAVASFEVPPDWTQLSDTTSAVSGGRRLVVYSSPTDADFNCFLLLTPVRGDYTSLGSFGTLDSVQDTIIPRGEDIDSKLISSSSSSGRYTYEYTILVPGQPRRHLKTIFSLAADNIVTFNVQTREETYSPEVAKISDAIMATFSIGKRSA